MNTTTSVTCSALLTMLSFTGGCASSGGAPAEATPRMQVILDYSPTLSDAGALLYLASNPRVELLAVTLPGTGEADCEPGTRTTRALLAVAGDRAVPVGCGRNDPLTGHRDWPDEWRAEVNRWGAEMLPAVPDEAVVDAQMILAEALAAATAPVTVVAVGPLTNLAVAFAAHPEYTDRIARIVIMGGAVTVPGNVDAAPAAEWNLYIDPEAAREVIASGVEVMFVPLDATNRVPWSERLLSRLSTLDGPAAHTVHEMAASRASLAGCYLWDELAAITAVSPGLVTVESMTITIDDDGAIVRDPSGVRVDVAVDAAAQPAIDEFLQILNGGPPPKVATLTDGEMDYLLQMNAADGRVNSKLTAAYRHLGSAAPVDHRAVSVFIDEFVAAATSLADDLRSMSPPDAFFEAHARYLDAVTQIVAGKETLLAAIASSSGDNLDTVMNDAFDDSGLAGAFEDMRTSCQALEEHSFARGGPRPCSAAADQ